MIKRHTHLLNEFSRNLSEAKLINQLSRSRKAVEVKPSAITEPIVLVTKTKTPAELKKMTKKALDTYAREEHNIELDGRLTKDKMIVSFNKEIKKKEKK